VTEKSIPRRLVAGLVFCIMLLLVGATPVRADGIGVYPAEISFADTLRGGEYFTSIGVINHGDQPRTFTLEASGEIASWIAFVDPEDRTKTIDHVTTTPGADGHADLRLTVPDSAQNGSYSGEVRTVAVVDGGKIEGSGSTLSLGASIEVKAVVSGNQRVAGKFLELAANDIEVGYPLRVVSKVQNDGNVRVLPQVHVEISTSGKVIGTIDTNDVAIPPKEYRDIDSQWDSNIAGPGEYLVTTTVTLPGVQLGQRTREVRIVPRGSLTRQGSFESLQLANEVVPGSVARVVASFRNTGQVDALAVFSGEIYRDGKLVKPVASLQKLVRRDEVQQLEALVELPGAGTYRVQGKVNFEGQDSETRELTFTVGSSSGANMTALYGAGGAGLLLVGGVAAFYVRKRSHQDSRKAA